MNGLEFLKRFGLLAAITAVLPGCASHRGAADNDEDERHERGEKDQHDEKHEHDEHHEHNEHDEKHEKNDDDDKQEAKPQTTP
jgi:hypothetical protein